MDVLYWVLIGCAFIIAFVGLVYPIIPSVVFMVLGFILYGLFFSFEKLTLTFWLIQAMFTAVLFAADYVSNLIGVKRFGGSRAAIWGSTIGLLAGPFVIPIGRNYHWSIYRQCHRRAARSSKRSEDKCESGAWLINWFCVRRICKRVDSSTDAGNLFVLCASLNGKSVFNTLSEGLNTK